MSRILAIDYGRKRCGIAVTDELKIIASGLTTVPTGELNSFLQTYFKTNKVETIVLGEPKKLDGTDTDTSAQVRQLKDQLEKKHKLPVVLYDERFTSKMAHQTMIDSGLKKMARRNKELVDEISATIILQGYLESRR
jgi:putative Holliday junction resolvase